MAELVDAPDSGSGERKFVGVRLSFWARKKRNSMSTDIRLCVGDLPDGLPQTASVGVDTETMGLAVGRDRLCLVQICFEPRGTCYLIKIEKGQTAAPNLTALLTNPAATKIFHYGRFDIAQLYNTFRVACRPVYCTRIASRLGRTYTNYHGLKDLCREFLGIVLNKTETMTDWGADVLTENQKLYAARDVLYLHELKAAMEKRLDREGLTHLAESCFSFLPDRSILDVEGFPEDLFAYHLPS